MDIGIIGSGMVGQTLGAKLVGLGHDVVIGTRDPGKLEEWLEQVGGNSGAGSNAEAARHGEVVINATAGAGALEALAMAGEENLDGKVLIDVSNPLDFSGGGLPTLLVKDTDSLGEQIQRSFPNAKVVKTLNTMNANVMVDPHLAGDGDHSVFISGGDEAAKAEVADLLRSFGWRDIIDLGDITTARGTEMLMPVWLRLMTKLDDFRFNFKIVR